VHPVEHDPHAGAQIRIVGEVENAQEELRTDLDIVSVAREEASRGVAPTRESQQSGLVSIVLPTYNRAGMLGEAFASIAAQTYPRWEVIVVDDGSTDGTTEVLDGLRAGMTGPVRIVRQANQGAYAARNTGLDHVTGDYVAFFDSDDLWLPHHLQRTVAALDAHATLDWAYGACRMVDMTGREISPSTFYDDGRPRPFLELHASHDGDLRLIDDPGALACQILHGLYCGLQNSVMRRRVFERRRFWPDYRVVEDELFVVRLLAEGGTFAYYDDVHVIYRVHGDNSSGSAAVADSAKTLKIYEEMIRGFERIGDEVPLPPTSRRALTRRLATDRFWGLGYSSQWRGGDRPAALRSYRRALGEWPWSARMWKTYALALIRSAGSD
jgi:glycosyltransferase involved in cell wall biosynthesis